MRLGDLLFREVDKGAILEDLLEPYKNRLKDIKQLISAYERLRWTKLEKRVKVVAVQWRKNTWNGENGIDQEIQCSFFLKDELLENFRWCEAYGAFDMHQEDWKKTGLEKLDYSQVLALCMHDHHMAPMFWSPSMATLVLSAQFAEPQLEPISKSFLRQFFYKCISFRDAMLGVEENEAPAGGRELTVEEQQDIIRYVYLYNKVSLSKAIFAACQQLQIEEELLCPVEMAQIAMEDPEQVDLPFFVVDECGCGDDFMIQLRKKLEEDHLVIHMKDPQAFVDRIMENPIPEHAYLLVGNFHEIENNMLAQRHLHRLVARGYRLTFVSKVHFSYMGIDDRFKELIGQGLTVTIE